MASADTLKPHYEPKPNIFVRTLNTVKAVAIWFLFFIFVGIVLLWVYLMLRFDYRIVLAGTVVVLFFVLKGVKRLFDWMNGRDDQKIEEKYGSSPIETPQNGGKNGFFAPSPLGVGEDGLNIDIKDAVLTFIDMYGEFNFKDDNVLKRIIESVPFRKVERGELDYTLAILFKNGLIKVQDGKVTGRYTEFKNSNDSKGDSEDKKPLPRGLHRKIWNICLYLVQTHGFDKFQKEADELFEKFPVSEFDNIIRAFRENPKGQGQIMFYHFKRKEDSKKTILVNPHTGETTPLRKDRKLEVKVSKVEKMEDPQVKVVEPEVIHPTKHEPRTPAGVGSQKVEIEVEVGEAETEALRKRLEIQRKLKELDEEMERKAKENQ